MWRADMVFAPSEKLNILLKFFTKGVAEILILQLNQSVHLHLNTKYRKMVCLRVTKTQQNQSS